MAGEADWPNHIRSVQRESISGRVQRQQCGEELVYNPPTNPDPKPDSPDENERAKAEGYEDKWHKRFAHLPGVPGPSSQQ
jgi:hypothetical protein